MQVVQLKDSIKVYACTLWLLGSGNAFISKEHRSGGHRPARRPMTRLIEDRCALQTPNNGKTTPNSMFPLYLLTELWKRDSLRGREELLDVPAVVFI